MFHWLRSKLFGSSAVHNPQNAPELSAEYLAASEQLKNIKRMFICVDHVNEANWMKLQQQQQKKNKQ